MQLYLDAGYPLILAVSGVLAVMGMVTMVWVRTHGLLRQAGRTYVGAIVAQAIVVVIAVFQGAPAFMTLSYAVASLAVLVALGISRLGTPEAAADDPTRPVLQPDQQARVDAGAALLVALAQAVIAWRFMEIFQAALA